MDVSEIWDRSQLLEYAIINQNDSMVQYLMSNLTDAELKDANEKFDYVTIASEIGNINYIRLLLSRGSELNYKPRKSLIDLDAGAIYKAIWAGHYHVIEYFLQNDIIPRDSVSDTLIYIIPTLTIQNIDFYKFLIRKYININDQHLISLICRYAHIDIFKYVIKMGADINYCFEDKHLLNDNEKFIHNAFTDTIFSNCIEKVKIVISLGIDVAKWYHTCYIYCLYGQSSMAIVDYLDENYAQYINLISYSDQLAMACIRGNVNRVQSIFDIKNKNENERGLYFAYCHQQDHIVHFLIKKMHLASYNIVEKIILKVRKTEYMPMSAIDINVDYSIKWLVKCCISNNFDYLKTILRKDCGPSLVTGWFEFLIYTNDIKSIRYIIDILLEENIKINNEQLIHNSIYTNNYTALDYLINKCATGDLLLLINLSSPLNKIKRTISYLVEKGADINYESENIQIGTIFNYIIGHYCYQFDINIYLNKDNTISDTPEDIYNKYYKENDNKVLEIIIHIVKLGYKFRTSIVNYLPFIKALSCGLFKVCHYVMKHTPDGKFHNFVSTFFECRKSNDALIFKKELYVKIPSEFKTLTALIDT